MIGPCVVILDRPKTPANVGTVFRSALALGAGTVIICGPRWPLERAPLEKIATDPKDAYRHLDVRVVPTLEIGAGMVPTHELLVMERNAPAPIFLDELAHPPVAAYVFGPEDGDVSLLPHRRLRFVEIRGAAELVEPRHGCLNLATSVSITLYARAAQLRRASP